MSKDTISRQEAIDAVCMEWCGVKHQDCKHPFDAEKDDYYWCDGCETALLTLPALPSAQPERKKGRWVMINDHTARCSSCNEIRWTNGHDQTMKGHIFYGIYKYCPECGAEMESEP